MASIGAAIVCAASAETIGPPDVHAGDTWVYRVTKETDQNGWNQTREEFAVTRVTASTIYFTLKAAGSTLAPKEIYVGRDWSRSRDVNGAQTVVNRPLAFPLEAGKSWDLDYTELNPNAKHKMETFKTTYTVVGLEPVEVAAGKFNAYKIEGEGHWQAELAPVKSITQGAQTASGDTTMVTQVHSTADRETSGRLYKAFWYVPEMKRWVKSVEENYSSSGVRHERTTLELESFKPASP
jgi:hypothetical protein